MSVKHRRIVGEERQTLAKELAKRYAEGESIRALVASSGRSYGFVHQVLTESGVQLRQRGGARPGRKQPWRPGMTQLVATLAAKQPGERVTHRQATATLRAVYSMCDTRRAAVAAKQHNAQLTPAGEEG